VNQSNSIPSLVLKLLLILVLPVSMLQAQSFIDSLQTPWRILPLDFRANDLECDEEGNLFLLDKINNRIYKYYAALQYDSIQSIGGKGMSGEGLNQPVKIRSGNRQTLYCLDAGNRRILVLNTNLKIIREVNFLTSGNTENALETTVQIWPLSFEAGPAGDLFLLNQEDNKILKSDMYGKFQVAFGGLDYGAGSLYDPADLLMSEDNLLYVSDTVRQILKVYDLFGVYLYNLYPPEKFHFSGFTLLENNLVYYNAHQICVLNRVTNRHHFYQPELKQLKIVDVSLNRKMLCILTATEIVLFR
jgi:hypothetical protein